MIKFGDIKYFTLLRLNDQLNNTDFHMLGLYHINKLRNEVSFKIKAIEYAHKQQNICEVCEGHGIIENSYKDCYACNGTGKILIISKK